MRFPTLPSKEIIRTKLDNHPALNAIVCLILFERWFRVAFLGVVLFVPVVPLCILKVWRTTPQDFRPVVKISALDLVQAWSLRKSAVKEAAKGHFEDALQSWRIAVANNPGDADLIRGCLTQMLQRPDPRKYSQIVIGYTSWLMRLTSTNVSDLELSTALYEAHGIDDMIVYVLSPREKELSPVLRPPYLKALFRRGEITEFATKWRQLDQQANKSSDPELELYYAAYQAGWGPHQEAADARQRLEQAKENPKLQNLAYRLQLKVSEQLVQVDTYRQSLDFLQAKRLDTLVDQTGLWKLLAMSGRKAEAIQLLRAHVQPPASGEEAVALAKAHFDLGFADEARDVLKRYAPEFTESEAVWLSYANLLMEQKKWDDLSQAAVQLRHEAHPLRDRLNSYSYYLQGVAEFHRGHPELAKDSFQKLIQAKIRNKVWELSAAETIERLGYSEIARELLLDIQKDVPNTRDYWLLLGKTAYETKDPNLLVTAMASAYKLRPDDIIVMNNYAAALLSTRQLPERAVQLTQTVLERASSIPTKINHCLALLQNQRSGEAESLLGTLNPSELRDQDLTYYHLVAFELKLLQRQYAVAKQHSEKIELQYLFSAERLWLEKAREEVEAKLSPTAKKS